MDTDTVVTPHHHSQKDVLITPPPPLFRVVMLNDDFTPMEFVVMVLTRYFAQTEPMAVQTMLKIHHEGRAIAGIYPRDIAETKMETVIIEAKKKKHPLSCIIEEDI